MREIKKPKKTIYIFSDGTRSIAKGNLMIGSTEPSESIDITEATEKEFDLLRSNPRNKSIIQKIQKRIDKEAKKG